MNLLFDLIRVKGRVLRGSLRSTEEGKFRAPFFVVLVILFWVIVFRGSYWLLSHAIEVELVGELLIQKLLSILVLIFFGLLSFSSVVAAFSTYFLADELQFLISKPISTHVFFTSRYLEVLLQSSWVVILFGLPPFIVAGIVIETGWTYYVSLPFVLLPFVAIPTSIASIISLLITNILAANRTRDVAIFAGGFAITVLFILVRTLKPEQLLNPDSFSSIGEMLDLLSAPSSPWLPSEWVMAIMEPLLFQSSGATFGATEYTALGLLVSTPLAIFFASSLLYRKFYMRGYTRVQEGRHGGTTTIRLGNLFRRRGSISASELNEERLQGLLAGLRKKKGKGVGVLRDLVTKDLRIFVRDAGQWSQVLIIVAIMVIYLVNYRHVQVASDDRFFGSVGLYFFNLAASAFVVVAMSGRFLFPSVSIEGRSFWMILQAPITLKQFLIGKWLGGMLPVFLVGQLLIISSNVLVVQSWGYIVVGIYLIAYLTIGISALSVGLGAVYPQFYNPNPAAIASSLGAVIYMILGMLMSLVVIALSYHVTRAVDAWSTGGAIYLPPRGIVMALIGWLIPLLVAKGAIALGARSLAKRM